MSKKIPLQHCFAPILKPIACAYAGLMRLRRKAYGQGVLSSYQPLVPTVSVGNISWGGTGKTPIVNWILAWAASKNLQAVVLTRGYKASPPCFPFLVQPHSNPKEAGDEPLMLACKNPAAKVVVDPKRSRAAEYAEKHLQPDLFVLDDGHQHLALGRDKNIVLLSAYDLTEGWGEVIPAGTWRESEKALNTADVFLLRVDGASIEQAKDFKQLGPFAQAGQGMQPDQARQPDQAHQPDQARQPDEAHQIAQAHQVAQATEAENLLALAKAKLPAKPIFPFCFRNFALRALTNPAQQLTSLAGRAYNLFCGVGSPQSVLRSTKDFLGYAPQNFFSFPDHYNYTTQNLEQLCASGLDLLCTEKDAVKLLNLLASMPSGYTPACSIWVLQLAVEFPPIANGLTFADWWESSFASIQDKL